MVTGYDHILFLLGVVFFLYRMKDVAIYVSIFALGHSVTMLAGVWWGWGINSYIIDAIIGLSVIYKALDNLGAYRKWFGFQPNTKAATLIFGLFHGTGLASKIIEYDISEDGLLWNLLAFNVGVEVGQVLALFGDPRRDGLLAPVRTLHEPGSRRQHHHGGPRALAHNLPNQRLPHGRIRRIGYATYR